MEMTPSDIHFIGIGAAKSGTTWVADMLRQHPDVFIPEKKELHYFNEFDNTYLSKKNLNFGKPLSWFYSFFKGAKSHQIKGEFSPPYLLDEGTAERLHSFNPNLKLLIILRNPVERSFSQYWFYRQMGVFLNESFEEALANKDRPIKPYSYYFKKLKKYYECFPAKQIKVMFFEDLKKDPAAFLTEIQTFLGVQPFIPANLHERSNVSYQPAFPKFAWAAHRTRQFMHRHHLKPIIKCLRVAGLSKLADRIRRRGQPFKKRPVMNEQTREQLKREFLPDINQLEALLSIDLSHWK